MSHILKKESFFPELSLVTTLTLPLFFHSHYFYPRLLYTIHIAIEIHGIEDILQIALDNLSLSLFGDCDIFHGNN